MKDKFDELAKGIAQSVTRRQALRKFGVGLAGVALACFGMSNIAKAAKTCLGSGEHCGNDKDCCSGFCTFPYGGYSSGPGTVGHTPGGKHPRICA